MNASVPSVLSVSELPTPPGVEHYVRVLLVLGTLVVAMVSAVGVWRLEQFVRRIEPPPVFSDVPQRLEYQRDPLAACKEARRDLSRPPVISFTEEAAVYQALITQHLLPTFDRYGLKPIASRRIIVDPMTVEQREHHTGSSRWWLNSACTEMPALAKSTARSFRFANRMASAPLPRLFSLPVSVLFAAPSGGMEERQRFFASIQDSAGFVRLSRVGFAPDMRQALVYIEHSQSYGWGSGMYFLLVLDGGRWRIRDTHLDWIA